jgi:hypothetical protein
MTSKKDDVDSLVNQYKKEASGLKEFETGEKLVKSYITEAEKRQFVIAVLEQYAVAGIQLDPKQYDDVKTLVDTVGREIDNWLGSVKEAFEKLSGTRGLIRGGVSVQKLMDYGDVRTNREALSRFVGDISNTLSAIDSNSKQVKADVKALSVNDVLDLLIQKSGIRAPNLDQEFQRINRDIDDLWDLHAQKEREVEDMIRKVENYDSSKMRAREAERFNNSRLNKLNDLEQSLVELKAIKSSLQQTETNVSSTKRNIDNTDINDAMKESGAKDFANQVKRDLQQASSNLEELSKSITDLKEWQNALNNIVSSSGLVRKLTDSKDTSIIDRAGDTMKAFYETADQMISEYKKSAKSLNQISVKSYAKQVKNTINSYYQEVKADLRVLNDRVREDRQNVEMIELPTLP